MDKEINYEEYVDENEFEFIGADGLGIFERFVFDDEGHLKTYENGKPVVKDYTNHISGFKWILGDSEWKHRMFNLGKYFRIGDLLAIKNEDNCLELYNGNRFNQALNILYNDFGGIFRILPQKDYDLFVDNLRLVDIHDYILFSKDNVQLSNDLCYEKIYIKVRNEYNVLNHELKTVTEEFLNEQGYEYSFLMDLLNVIFNYGFMKKGLYFYGKKDAFKTSFVDKILAGCVGRSQFYSWTDETRDSGFPFEGFKEHQLLVLVDDPVKIDEQAWKTYMSEYHNVSRKNRDEYYEKSYKTFIITRNFMLDKIAEDLDNRLIFLEFNKCISDSNPALYDKLEIWFKPNDNAYKMEIEQILYDYSEYIKNVSVKESIENIEALQNISIQKSIYDVALAIMVDNGDEGLNEIKEEYDAAGIELEESDLIDWDFKEFLRLLKDIKKVIPSELSGSIPSSSIRSALKGIRENVPGFEFGNTGHANPYRGCKLVYNVEKVIKRLEGL